MSRTIALVAMTLLSSGCASPAPASGPSGSAWPWPESAYRYQGTGHYENKRLLDIQAEFSQLAVSPSGKQVVFQGRESQDDYALFIAELDGTIRKLAKTGLEPQRIAWTSDEKSIVFLTVEVSRDGFAPDTPASVPSLPVGYTLWRLSLETGEQKPLMRLRGHGGVFVSPDGAQVLLNGFVDEVTSTREAGLDLVDAQTGAKKKVAADIVDLYNIYSVSWHPDGQVFAAFGSRLQGPAESLTRFNLPEGSRTEWGEIAWSSGQVHLQWQTQGTALDAFFVAGDGQLTRQRYMPGSAKPEVVHFPMPARVDGERATYENLWPSPNGDRVLLMPPTAVFATVANGPSPLDSRTLVLASLKEKKKEKAVRETAYGITPVGWLDDRRILGYTGREQYKRLVVFNV